MERAAEVPFFKWSMLTSSKMISVMENIHPPLAMNPYKASSSQNTTPNESNWYIPFHLTLKAMH